MKSNKSLQRAESAVGEYDPYEERKALVDHPTTNFETCFHIIKGCLGIGVLSMPSAFSSVGMLNGFIFTVMVGILVTYCSHTFFRTEYELCKKRKVPMLNYSEMMKAVLEDGPVCLRRFAKYMPTLVNVCLMLNQAGICSAYIIFVRDNLLDVVGARCWDKVSVRQLGPSAFVLFLAMGFMKNLKNLAPVSIFGTIVQLAVFVILGGYWLPHLPPFEDLTLINTSLYRYPLFFGSALFSMTTVSVDVSVEHNAEEPRHFYGVLNVAMTFVTIMNVLVGLFGYWKYGRKVFVLVTLNLPNDWVADSALIAYALVVLLSYALNSYCAYELIWFEYKLKFLKNTTQLKAWNLITRLEFVCATFMCAAVVPSVELIMAFTGLVSLINLAIIFPAIMKICLLHPNYKKQLYTLIANSLLLLFGICNFLVGSFLCIDYFFLNFFEKYK